MTFPALISFRAIYPHIDALCQKKLGGLARKLNLIDKSYALESAAVATLYGDSSNRVDAKTATFLQSYERIVIFSFSRKLQENIERFSGTKVLRIPPRPPAGEKIHVSRFLWKHLARAGLLEGLMYPPSDFMANLPRQYSIEAASGPVLIHPGSGSRKKNWPLENFILLEKMLRKDGLRADFILGPAEIYLQNGLAAAPAPHPPVHMVDNLLRALALLKSACGFIGNDSGLAHLAAVVGLPTVAVFGSSDPVRWKPLGPAVAVVRSDTDCSPCHETDQRTCNSLDCFKGISPQMVHAAFSGLNTGGPRIDIYPNVA
jgi:hypothetical protein